MRKEIGDALAAWREAQRQLDNMSDGDRERLEVKWSATAKNSAGYRPRT